jgi:enamine deaminase RidA (YjgF/YER057c/UK114 family)
MTLPEQRLAELQIQLPPAPKPVAAYVPALRYGDLVLTSGQLPIQDGKILVTGKLGLPVSIGQGREAARLACLNALAVVRDVAGTLDQVQRILSLTVYVQSNDAFTDQPKVANGASELLEAVFGEQGRHVRAAVGVNSLPLNASVELSLTVALRKAGESAT